MEWVQPSMCVLTILIYSHKMHKEKKKEVHIHNTGMITENATVRPDHRMMETT